MKYKRLPKPYIEKNRPFVIGFWVMFVIVLILVFIILYYSNFFAYFNSLINPSPTKETIPIPEDRVSFLGSLSIDDWEFYIEKNGTHTGWTYRNKDVYILFNQTFSDTHTTCCHEICHNYMRSLEENNLSKDIGAYFIENYNMSIGQAAEEQMCHGYSASCNEPVCDKLITMLRSYK